MNIRKPTDALSPEEAKKNVGEGWHRLIDLAYDAIRNQAPHVIITTVKEKFGGLRIYTLPYEETVDEAIQSLCQESLDICETCGEPGTLRNMDGLYATRCDAHSGGYRIVPDPLGQMRNY